MAALPRSWQQFAAWLYVSAAACSACIGGQTGTPDVSGACRPSKTEVERAERELAAFEGRYVGTAAWEVTTGADTSRAATTSLQVELVVVDGTTFPCAASVSATGNVHLRSDDGKVDVSLQAGVTRDADGSVRVEWQASGRAISESAHSGQLLIAANSNAALETTVGVATLRAPILVKEDE